MWRRDGSPDGRALAAECEAFLAGRYVEHLVEAGAHVAPWAWTNLLAHGSEEQLRCPPVTLRVGQTGPLEAWCLARSYLAGEVLDLAHRNGPLGRIQGRVLLPLELELAGRPAAWWWTPGEWVAAVLDALAPLTAWHPTRHGT